MPVELRWTGLTADVMPPDSVMLNRYRILQEALTNVLKHAGAASVIVTIVERAGETTIEVVDDGAGGADIDAGTGLRGLEDRVAALGGSLRITSRPGAGTTIKVELPCESS